MVGTEQSSVIYIGHLPDGFFEAQMREYFNQFGTVKKVKVCRSLKVISISFASIRSWPVGFHI